jgi:hypothetical protein
MPACRRNAVSGALLAASFLYPALSDAFNVTIPAFFPDLFRSGLSGPFAGAVLLGLEFPHTLFHAIGGAVVAFIVLAALSTAIIRGPYREGDRWAWRVLVFGGMVSLAVKLTGSFVIFMHPIWYGLEQDVQIPLAFLIAGLLLSWRHERSQRARSLATRAGG